MKLATIIIIKLILTSLSYSKTVGFKLTKDNRNVVICSANENEKICIKNLSFFKNDTSIGQAWVYAEIDDQKFKITPTSQYHPNHKDIDEGNAKIGRHEFILHGPITLSASKSGDSVTHDLLLTYTIEPLHNTTTAKYATVIPENTSKNVDIILEQSTDLVNWSPTNPGNFKPNAKKRFFRVRAESK